MPLWLKNLFEQSNYFMPHGHCYLWLPTLLWLHVVSDVLIGTAYVCISLILYLFVRKIRLPFSPIFIAFGLFIGLCGMTHFMAVWTVWKPDYMVDGLIKAATAAASVATAIGLFRVRPQVYEVVHAARLSEERRVQLETTLAEMNELYKKIKELDELKSKFFANVSHELRTPLALILGPVEHMLEDSRLDTDHRRQLESINRNSKSLLKQVNDLLDVAKLEEGKVEARYTRLDLVPVFQRIASQFDIAAEHNRIQYHISLPDALSVEVDPNMLEKVLVNLLSNAFKFTPSGGEIRFELSEGKDEFRFSVKDTGPGISPDEVNAIFERFHQVDGGSTRRYGGIGLGLSIARDFIELHKGKIEVETKPGAGTCFFVHLPRYAPDHTNIKQAPYEPDAFERAVVDGAVQVLAVDSDGEQDEQTEQVAADRPSVLVVEDTGEMRRFVVNTLRADYNVVAASNGKEGLESALAMRPDLVVTDIMMPEMSGDQLVFELRGRNEFDTVPILLLSARADDELRVKLLQEGAQDYLTKPFLPQELQARVRNLMSIKRAGDELRVELASASNNVEELAKHLAVKHRQLLVAMDATEVAREQAEKANQIKSQFLAMISHEMRTPLSTINMNAQLLGRQTSAQTNVTDAPRERIVRAAQHLSTVIEGLLEYTRLESGKIVVTMNDVDLAALATEIVEAGQLQVPSSKVTLSLETPPSDLAPCVTDARLLRVILTNLVSNALKFTQEGRITLRLEKQGGYHIFEVEDTGIGIAEADIPRIFLPFEQLEPVQRKGMPGVGLGLSLVKEIVEALDGEIKVESRRGSGSVFRVKLPCPAEVNRHLKI